MSPGRILFIELLGGIGDLLVALPTIQALGRSHPDAALEVLTFAPGSTLLEADPRVRRVRVAPEGGARAAVEEALADGPWSLVVSDTRYEGIGELVEASGAERTVADLWRGPPPGERVGERFLRILLEEGVVSAEAAAEPARVHLRPEEAAAARDALGALARPVVALLPEAGMAVKRWPPERFAALGRELLRRFGGTVLVLPGSDAAGAEHVARAIGPGAVAGEVGPLRRMAAELAEADLAVGADTGPLRLAARLGVPTLTLFGPSWSGRYAEPAPHASVQAFPECPERDPADFTRQACWYGGECPLDRWGSCMEEITPARAAAEAARLLRARGFGERSRKTGEVDAAWRGIRRLLVMRLDNIGDVVMTGPALRALKGALPGARLTLLASPAGARAVPLLPWVDEVIAWPVLWQEVGERRWEPAREWALVERLRRERFDAAVIFTSFSQSPHPPGFLCRLAGIPLRLGESAEAAEGTLTHAAAATPYEAHQVERNLRLLAAIGVEPGSTELEVAIPEEARERARALLAERGVAPGEPYLLLNPFASAAARTYSTARFASAARALSERTGWPVVVTGVERDRAGAAPLLECLGSAAVELIGATGVPELAAALSGARLVLTNNTSTMHLADALRVPAVVLFAGTELERQWRPRSTPHRLLRRPTPCAPCHAFECAHAMECLDIAPEEVVDAALGLLGAGVPAGAGGRP